MIFERGHFQSKSINESFITDSLREVKMFSHNKQYTNSNTVFLSHKHSDLKELQGVMGLLKEFGVKVYIDSMDNKIPKETSGETAKRIKEVIKYCKKFVLLATEDAIASYWCNWELGFGDTHKFKSNLAILPIKEIGEYDHQYKGNEYLQIYPKINYRNAFTNIKGDYFKSGYYVENPDDNYITELSDWLKQ